MKLLAAAIFVLGSSHASAAIHLERITLPKGFKISLYTNKVPNARQMALAPDGTLFVGSRQQGNVYAVTPSKEVVTIASGLNMPSGVAFKDGDLYVAAVNKVLRFEKILSSFRQTPKPAIVTDTLPKDAHHGWKFIAFGPDGFLYVPVGAPCNVCKSEDPRYASILRMKTDGSRTEVFASGVRNTVGFDWHPVTRELWFTDNGRDLMGDEIPPDELNRASKPGQHFGFPYCHAGRVADPEFGKSRTCSEFTGPAASLGPHVAAIGMRFYTGKSFPKDYLNQVFIAEHGSWNRSSPLGYRITVVRVDGTKTNYESFAEGWLGKDGEAWGRPADVLVHTDGSLLISDDRAGAIYKISYESR